MICIKHGLWIYQPGLKPLRSESFYSASPNAQVQDHGEEPNNDFGRISATAVIYMGQFRSGGELGIGNWHIQGKFSYLMCCFVLYCIVLYCIIPLVRCDHPPFDIQSAHHPTPFFLLPFQEPAIYLPSYHYPPLPLFIPSTSQINN
jgi:hypothetical protein